MSKPKHPVPPEGPALGRARQFTVSHGVPDPQVEGALLQPVPTPVKETAARVERKKTRVKPAR